MTVRIYRDKDVNLVWLKRKTCAVIGFGAQGRAHALNLRDSEIKVVVGLYRGSKSRSRARRNRLKVFETAEAVRRGDVIFLALPDTAMPAVHQNPSGRAKRTALAWAKAIGCTRAVVIETTFRDETETDLFGEQAVLCGGTSALVRSGFDTLVNAGYPPELAYFECLHELKFIVDLIHEAGMTGMRALISDTAKWGELTVGPRIIGARVQKEMRAVLRDIRSGKFAREFIHEMRTGKKQYQKLRKAADSHRIEKVG